MIVDMSGVDVLLRAAVEIVFLQAAKDDPSFAEAVQVFTALPVEGGEQK